jgi:hypothetical protein
MLPYAPLLPVSHLEFVSYNTPVVGASIISSCPTHLESTSLVVAAGGLDIFCSTVSTVQAYDLLSGQFNYVILGLSVVVVLAVTVVTSRLAQRKTLNDKWK